MNPVESKLHREKIRKHFEDKFPILISLNTIVHGPTNKDRIDALKSFLIMFAFSVIALFVMLLIIKWVSQ